MTNHRIIRLLFMRNRLREISDQLTQEPAKVDEEPLSDFQDEYLHSARDLVTDAISHIEAVIGEGAEIEHIKTKQYDNE